MVRIQIYFEDRLTDLLTDGWWERKVMVTDDSKVLGRAPGRLRIPLAETVGGGCLGVE